MRPFSTSLLTAPVNGKAAGPPNACSPTPGPREASASLRADVDPAALADRKVLLRVGGEDHVIADRFGRGVRERGQDVEAVGAVRRREDAAGQGSHRGQHVHVADELVRGGPRLDPAGPAGDQRHAVSALPGVELESEQIAVETVPGLPSVLAALVQHTAVVAGEDDERVVAELATRRACASVRRPSSRTPE